MKLVILFFVCLVEQVNGECYLPPETPTPTTLTATEGTIDHFGITTPGSSICDWIFTPPAFSDVLLRINLTRFGTYVTSGCQPRGLHLPDGSVHCADHMQFTGACFLYTSLSTPPSCQDDITRQTCGNASVLTANQWPPSIRLVHGFLFAHLGFTLDYKFINCAAEISDTTTGGLAVTTTTDEPDVKPQFELPIYFYPAIGGAVLLILIVIICIVMIKKRRNKKPRFLGRPSTDIIVRNDYVGSSNESTTGLSNDNPDGKSSYNALDETFIADVPTYATIETGPDALARMTSSNAQSNFDATSETWTTTNLPTYATIETGPDGLARMTNANAGTEPLRKSRSSTSPTPQIPSRKPRTHTIEEITHNQSLIKETRSDTTPGALGIELSNSATGGSAEQAPYDVAGSSFVGTVGVINMTSPATGLAMAGPDESEYVIMANPNDVNAGSRAVYTNECKEDDDEDDFTSDESDDDENLSPIATNLYSVIKK